MSTPREQPSVESFYPRMKDTSGYVVKGLGRTLDFVQSQSFTTNAGPCPSGQDEAGSGVGAGSSLKRTFVEG